MSPSMTFSAYRFESFVSNGILILFVNTEEKNGFSSDEQALRISMLSTVLASVFSHGRNSDHSCRAAADLLTVF